MRFNVLRGPRPALGPWILAMTGLALAGGKLGAQREAGTPGLSTVSGRVTSSFTGQAVTDALVRIEGPTLLTHENWQIRRTADADGRYSFTVPPGGYELSTSAPDHEEVRRQIEVGSGADVVHDVRLSPQDLSYAYRVETVELPRRMIPEVSGIAFTPRGSLVAVNRRGEIWIRSPDGRNWRRFARGLYEPFGVIADSDEVIYVMQRPELTRVRDTDGDGVADAFETVDDSWGISGNYHEFTYGLARDSRGRFYGGLGMVSSGDFPWVRGPLKEERVMRWTGRGRVPDGHRSVVQYQGWMFRISANEEFEPIATGFRQPLGIGISPDDELFVTDVSGAWVPTSVLHHVEKGRFYGHPDGLKWDPDFQDRSVTLEMLRRMRTPPVVSLPRGLMGTSPGQPVWDTTGGKFGPFGGQMLVGDVTSLLMRIQLEKVAGAYQGAVFPLLRHDGLRIGGMRNVFAPDGSLYIAQTVRGWMSTEGNEGIQRVVWTGDNPVEILSMRLTERGFALTFTEGMNPTELAQTGHYRVRRFQFDYHILNGSLRRNEVEVPVVEARSIDDGTGVELRLVELLPGFVYALKMDALKSRRGRRLLNPEGYYTANRLLTGETEFEDSILNPLTTDDGRPPDPIAGREIFRQNCMVCHQADGRGSAQVGTPDFTGVDGRLREPDAVLLESIRNGKGLIMPAFGNVLPEIEIYDALAYIRDSFQAKPAAR